MIDLQNKKTLLPLLPRLFQEDGEGAILRELFAATDPETATEAELRALYDALIAGVIRWLIQSRYSILN